ncbi:Chorismate synthase protein [Coniochaeta hoffmannii]|uniref:Chorismate synthase protein n=1 Tax=Coniochaeta hoffmannii TaxID=91930 RepID=A0AA38W1L3_9PEZI|nr:Chorismate synthase protein [Coniochaeta hoffmannii]
MATISWGTIKSLLLFFGPLVLPKAIGYYRSARAAPSQHGLTVRPLSPTVFRSLLALLLVSLVFLVKTLPIFAPENIFRTTQSRLQIPVDVLFTRLSAVRPLTAADTTLRSRFVNLESRLLYIQHGPDALSTCPFCTADEPRSYLFYGLPAILAPHLFNLAVLALATSSTLSGREASSWRRAATLAAVTLAAADVYLASTYPYQSNARALRLEDVDFFFWAARARRYVCLALLDGAVAWVLYLSSTNRAFVIPPTPAERIEAATRILGGAKSKLNAVGIVKNTAIRDEELRARTQAYWAHEGVVMRDVMEEREVVEGVNDALANRIDIRGIERDAETYAANVLLPRQGASRLQ